MPTYDWRCQDCKHEMEVVRKMSESDQGPDNGCEKCASKNVEKFIKGWSKHQTIKVWGGIAPFHDEEYNKHRSIR